MASHVNRCVGRYLFEVHPLGLLNHASLHGPKQTFRLQRGVGWQPFVQFRAMVGNNQFNNYAGIFGLRVEL